MSIWEQQEVIPVVEEINQRAQQLLHILVNRYIREGHPISSKSLAGEREINLSPASIRNVLAELEDRGYLRSLHTSSGRVPTAQGYRLFVNSLLTSQALTANTFDMQTLQQQLNPEQSINSLISNASNLISELTHMAGLVTVPRIDSVTLTHVEFVSLSNNRVLVILVFNEKEVQNRIIQTERNFSRSELEQAANYLNQQFAGHDLANMRSELVTSLHRDRATIDHIMETIIAVADAAFTPEQDLDDYVITGERNLLGLAEETDLHHLRQLFDAFTQKRQVLYLLDKCLAAEEFKIFIGEESGYDAFDACSLVSAPYYAKDKVVGVLAVIGPTRMPYDQVIPIVEITAKLLTSALES